MIETVTFNYLSNSKPSQENSSVIYFGSSFIFENNRVNYSLYIGDINCDNLFIGTILYFKADFYFKGENSSTGYKICFNIICIKIIILQ